MASGPEILPTARRGFDRDATLALLGEQEQRRAALARERDELLKQVEELRTELEGHRSRVAAVAEALVSAQQMAADLRATTEAEMDAERGKIDEERQRLVEEGATIRADARQEATEIVREARVRAERLAHEVVAALREYQLETDNFLDRTRERLDSLVGDLVGRIPAVAPDAPVTAEPVAADEEPPAADIVAA
jgi:cell division septum initiation protein DivIVA